MRLSTLAGRFTLASTLAAALGLACTAQAATHYPPGSLCYDCHAVSASKMVSGTHLIRVSQKTKDFERDGWIPGAPMPCLFCHDKNAVSVQGRVVMKDAAASFGAGVLSKHDVARASGTLRATNPTWFECIDCHTQVVTAYVVSDTSGNASIHGRDPSATDTRYPSALPATATLLAATAEATCTSAACHNYATQAPAYGPYNPPKLHPVTWATPAKITLNDVPGSATGCLTGTGGCHTQHGSAGGEELLTLVNTSGSNGAVGTGRTVQLNECEVCHTEDENGSGYADAGNNYAKYGHGKAGVTCETCHELRHSGAGGVWVAGSRLKAELQEDTTPQSNTSFGTNFLSNCKYCHQRHASHTARPPGGFQWSSYYPVVTGRSAGCRDCHDQHGTTAADAAFQNDGMIRRTISGEDTRLSVGRTVVFRDWFISGQTYGVCDNAACHDKIQAGQSLGTAGVHLGGTLLPTTCARGAACHFTHLTAKEGEFGIGQDCDGCHKRYGVAHTTGGKSAPTHDAHSGSPYAGGSCNGCHTNSGPGTTGDGDHLNGIVNFGGTYMTTAFDYAPAAPFNDTGCGGAANGCHGAEPGEWVLGNLGANSCQNCHASGIGKLLDQGGYPPTTNKHAQHTGSNALPQTGAQDCFACHDTTIDAAGAFRAGGTHLNMAKDVAFNSAYGYEGSAGGRTGSGATTTCSNVRCHNGIQTPVWSATIVCGQCHNTSGTGPVPSGASVAGNHGRHARNAWPTADCDDCHGNAGYNPSGTRGGSAYTVAGGGGASPGGLHQNLTVEVWINGAANRYGELLGGGGVDWTAGSDKVDNGTCSTTYCHGTGTPTWGGVLVNGCADCHGTDTADLDDYGYKNGTLAVVKLAGEWDATGHGRTTGSYPSGNAPAAFAGPTGDPKGCRYCHDTSVLHGVGTNPFRLVNKGVLARGTTADGGWNDACLVCHMAGKAGYDPDAAGPYALRTAASKVDKNHYGKKHGAATEGGAFCWDCHDPHGDTNFFMIHSGDGSARGKGVTLVSEGVYGVPTTSRPVAGLTWSTAYTSANLVQAGTGSDGTYQGLCQTCHDSAAGGAKYYNRQTFTALASHNGADQTRCTLCHPHDLGFAPACGKCHGDIPGLGIRGDDTAYPPEGPVASRTGKPGALNWAETKATPATVGHHAKHYGTYGTVDCEQCHVPGAGTDAAHNTNKPNATMNALGASWTAGTNPGTQSVVDDTCANITCHDSTYGVPANVYKSPANPSYVRFWNSTLDCLSCHGYGYNLPGAVATVRPTGNEPIATGSHAVHISYAVPCSSCHNGHAGDSACASCHPLHGAGSPGENHKNGAVIVGFTGLAVGGSYDADGIGPYTSPVSLQPRQDGNGYYCVNVYCHSSGTVRAVTPTITYANTTRWATAASGVCGTCHGVDGQTGVPAGMTTNVHGKHTGALAGQYGYDCAACHLGVTAGTKPSYTIASTTLHVNKVNDVSFGVSEGTYGTTGGTVGPVGGTCTATYCHSKGLDFSAPYTGTGTAAATLPDWDLAPGTLTCHDCHGDGVSIAYPAYANDTSIQPGATVFPKKNSHAAHRNYTCDHCHYATTTTGTTITNTTLHGNRVWDLQAGGGSTFTVQAGTATLTDAAYTPTTCQTISCHNGGSAQWGATLGCNDCHFGASDRDNWSLVDGTPSAIGTTEWGYSGHGKATGSYDGTLNGPAAFAGPAGDPNGCRYCHSASVPHGQTTNPFRLANKNVLARTTPPDAGWNDTCLVCHKAGDGGYVAGTGYVGGYNPGAGYASKNGVNNVDKAHYGTKHLAPAAGGNFCWDCHDPHGDRLNATTGNLAMVHASVAKTTDGTTGTPLTWASVTFTANGTGTDYAKSAAPFNGVCNVCHTTADHYKSTVGDGHQSASRCVLCHPHNREFAPVCNKCHGEPADNSGRPPATVTTAYGELPAGGSWAAGVDPLTGSPTGVGDHRAVTTTTPPVLWSSHGSIACSECHTATPGIGADHNDGGANATMTRIGTHGWTGAPAPAAAVWTPNAAGRTTSVTDDTCANIDCHSPYYNGNAGRSGTPQPYLRQWLNSTRWDCYTCHGYDGTSPAPSGRPTLDFVTSGSHNLHIGNGGMMGNTYTCQTCHPNNAGNNWHKTGGVDFPFTALFDPYAVAETYSAGGQAPTDGNTVAGHRAYGTCTNVYCHSSVQGTPPTTPPVYQPVTWGTTPLNLCGTCHNSNWHTSATNPPPMASGSHGEHSYGCDVCHFSTADGCMHCHMGTKHANYKIEVALQGPVGGVTLAGSFTQGANVGFAVPGGAYGQCTNVYCHSDARAVKAGTATTVTYQTITWGTVNLAGCEGCHGAATVDAKGTYGYGAPDYANGGTATKSANSHEAHGFLACSACHNSVITDPVPNPTTGWNIADSALHVNAVIDVAIAAAYDTNGATGNYDLATKTCSAITCHGAGSPQWGGVLTNGCGECHLRTQAAGGDRDNWSPADGTLSLLDSDEWAYSGHGKASGSYDATLNGPGAFSGPAGDPNGCRYCHSASVPHGQTANPFRLANQSVVGRASPSDGGWNDNCLVCHRTGDAGYVSGIGYVGGYNPGAGYATKNGASNVDDAHHGSKHLTNAGGGNYCWDCHDPHGDRYLTTGNIAMVQRAVATTSNGTTGIPQTWATVPVTFTANAAGTDYAKSSAPYDGVCNVCHITALHYRSTSGDGHGGIQPCTTCHKHTKGFGADCVMCHDYGVTDQPAAPKVVWKAGTSGKGVGYEYGTHLKALKTDAVSGATDWNAQCNKCHSGHSGSVVVPLPPASWADPSGRLTGTNMQTRLGITWATTGGIHLGGTSTSGTTEADLCWNCHANAANNVSEWGYNTKTTPAGFPVVQLTTSTDGLAESYNAGWIYLSDYVTKTRDWTAGYFMDQYDPLLKSPIVSVHTASFDPAGQSSSVAANVKADSTVERIAPLRENKSFIRCSYCHDVHDTVGRTGKPYLRGTWVGNPYPPDLPPRTRGSHPWMEGPRLVNDKTAAGSRSKMGYFIDQNSNYPTTTSTAMDTPEETQGLCTLCHGANVDTMDFYTGSKLWRADTVNGHSNSTLGGTRVNARNLFEAGAARGVPHGMTSQLELGGRENTDGSFYWYYNGCDCPAGYSEWWAWDNAWYTAGGIGGAWGPGTMAHKFTCSKCHSPHASRLPALLLYNCVDTTLSNPGGGWGNGLLPEASNCHRKTSTTDGWHRLAPRQ